MHPKIQLIDSVIVGLFVGSYIGAGLSEILPIQISTGLGTGVFVGIAIAVLLRFAAIGKGKEPSGWQIGAWVGGVTSIVNGLLSLVRFYSTIGIATILDAMITILSYTIVSIVFGGIMGILTLAIYNFFAGFFRKSSGTI